MYKKLVAIGCGMCLGLIAHTAAQLYKYQEDLLFKYRPLKLSHVFSSHHDFEEVFIETPDASKLHAMLYKTPNPKGVFVYFHGRGGNLASWSSVAQQLVGRGYDVLMMDYRGFGKSRGLLSEEALCRDAVLMYEYALNRYGPDQIVVYGRSLGTGLAIYVASVKPIQLLILEAPYFNMRDLISLKFPLVPKLFLSLILKYPLRADRWIENVSANVEIFHGTEDQLIPYHNSELLYKLAAKHNSKAHLTIIPGGTHNDLTYHEEYNERLNFALNSIKKY